MSAHSRTYYTTMNGLPPNQGRPPPPRTKPDSARVHYVTQGGGPPGGGRPPGLSSVYFRPVPVAPADSPAKIPSQTSPIRYVSMNGSVPNRGIPPPPAPPKKEATPAPRRQYMTTHGNVPNHGIPPGVQWAPRRSLSAPAAAPAWCYAYGTPVAVQWYYWR